MFVVLNIISTIIFYATIINFVDDIKDNFSVTSEIKEEEVDNVAEQMEILEEYEEQLAISESYEISIVSEGNAEIAYMGNTFSYKVDPRLIITTGDTFEK